MARNGSRHPTEFGFIASFVELDGFRDDWKDLGFDDDDLFDLENQILAWPERAPVIPGTGGLRKLRFASSRQRMGKRGAARIGYVSFPQHGIVVLAIAFAKNVKKDLFAWEKKAFREMIRHWDREFSLRHNDDEKGETTK